MPSRGSSVLRGKEQTLKRLSSLLLIVFLAACAPALAPTAPPEGYSLTVTPTEGYSLVRLEVAAQVERAYLVVIGSDLVENADECVTDDEGDVSCILGALSEFYELPVGGTVERVAALVCANECYALRTP